MNLAFTVFTFYLLDGGHRIGDQRCAMGQMAREGLYLLAFLY